MGKRVDFCVLCFSDGNNRNLLNLTGEELVAFGDKFYSIFHLKISVEASVQRYVCTSCVNKVEDFYEFFKKVIENYNKLNENLIVALGKKCHIGISSPEKDTSKEDHAEVHTIKQECEEMPPFNEIELCEKDMCNIHRKVSLVESSANVAYNSNHKRNECEIKTLTDLENVKPDFDVIENEINDEKQLDIPEHLKTRTPKKISDAKIRAFMDLACELCESKDKFNSFKEMQLHYQNQHQTRGFIRCCGKKIYRKDRVMDHITLHTNPDAFRCPKCGQRSKSKVLLRIHLKQHLPVEERPFQCNTCEQRFVLKSQLNNHQATHLSADEKKYICDVCGKAFALKFVLLKHKLTHTLEKPYFCEVCARTFATKGNLTSHVRTHTNVPEPRVQCEECGQWYKNLQTLRSHTHRHRDTRDHICEICSKKCSSKSSLMQHVRYVHHKVSNFECNICHKLFRRRPELTEHIARHTGEVLYKCQFCPKTFFSSSNFFAHRKTKHPREYATLSQQKQI